MESKEFHKKGVIFLLFILLLFVFYQPQFSYATSGKGNLGENQLREGSFHLSDRGGLLSLNAQSADLREILQEISEKTGIEIEIHPDVRGTITTSLRGMPIDDAIKSITDNLAMVSVKKKGQKASADIEGGDRGKFTN